MLNQSYQSMSKDKQSESSNVRQFERERRDRQSMIQSILEESDDENVNQYGNTYYQEIEHNDVPKRSISQSKQRRPYDKTLPGLPNNLSPMARDNHKVNSSQIIENSREHLRKKKDGGQLRPPYLDMSNISGSGLGVGSNFAPEVMFQGNLVSQQMFANGGVHKEAIKTRYSNISALRKTNIS